MKTKENPVNNWVTKADKDLLSAEFHDSLMESISRVRSGEVKWHSYDEVFNGSSL